MKRLLSPLLLLLLSSVSFAVDFDGTDDDIGLGNDAILNGGDEFTIAAWVYLDSVTADGAIYNAWDGASPGTDTWALLYADNEATDRYRCLVRYSNSTVDDVTATLTTGQWQHVVVTFKKNDNMVLYLDGSSADTEPTSNLSLNTTSSTARTIGGTAGDTRELNGRLDDLRVYSVALSATEVEALYKGTRRTAAKRRGPRLDQLLLWLPMRDKSIGTTVTTGNLNDISGSDNDPTVIDSSPTFSEPGRN